LICRDQNYPELGKRYKNSDVDLIFILSSHFYPPREAQLKIDKNKALPIARAVENGLYVFKANSIGKQYGYVNLGRSIIVDRDGSVIYEAVSNQEELFCYEI
jgi:predicted amidohydrolase